MTYVRSINTWLLLKLYRVIALVSYPFPLAITLFCITANMQLNNGQYREGSTGICFLYYISCSEIHIARFTKYIASYICKAVNKSLNFKNFKALIHFVATVSTAAIIYNSLYLVMFVSAYAFVNKGNTFSNYLVLFLNSFFSHGSTNIFLKEL